MSLETYNLLVLSIIELSDIIFWEGNIGGGRWIFELCYQLKHFVRDRLLPSMLCYASINFIIDSNIYSQ